MPVDLSKLNALAILTNITLEAAGPVVPSNIFTYVQGALNTLARDRIAIAEFDTQSHTRRRNTEDNTTLYNIALPRFTLTPDLSHKMLGSRVHIDASLSWEQPSGFGRMIYHTLTSGMLWHYRMTGITQGYTDGTLLAMQFVYYRDGVSEPDTRLYEMFW